MLMSRKQRLIVSYLTMRRTIGVLGIALPLVVVLGGFIENPFLLRARPPLPKHQSEERYASIDVINTSHVTIEKCFLTLDDILDNDGNSIIYSQ